MAYQPCIDGTYKVLLEGMIEKHVAEEILKAVIGGMPACSGKDPSGAVTVVAKTMARTVPERWPEAIYYDEKGQEHAWDSPSALYTDLTGLPISGQVCDMEGKSCRALSIIDNFQIRGYVVRGDGDEPPTPARVDASRSEIERAHQNWKAKLNSEGKKFIVYHPQAPQIKAEHK